MCKIKSTVFEIKQIVNKYKFCFILMNLFNFLNNIVSQVLLVLYNFIELKKKKVRVLEIFLNFFRFNLINLSVRFFIFQLYQIKSLGNFIFISCLIKVDLFVSFVF